MTRLRRTVLLAALALLAAWIAANFTRLTGEQHGAVRFVLGTLFAALILCRGKPPKASAPARRPLLLAMVGACGALAAIGGIVFKVYQVEWLGIVLLLYACLRWSLADRFAGDIARALVVLYWVHPLPAQIFGPLQLAMQQWSIAGAEWVLHGFNIRVWADGLYLYAGYDVIGVPESCSGMRTALSVLL
ncbi:MAG: archaeosortase/exosortase family protein, partial [Verrucomicrobia bacterium]|nr:archaeosortase/exosortase family protein [Verrucomicrobiota bacterium]